jgi:hypothetical protein
VTGDFNHDGKIDIAVANSNAIRIAPADLAVYLERRARSPMKTRRSSDLKGAVPD